MIDLSAFTILSGFSDLTITTGENGVTIDLIAHGGGTTSELGRDASWRTGALAAAKLRLTEFGLANRTLFLGMT